MKTWQKFVIRNTVVALVPGRRILRKALRHIWPYRTDPAVDDSLVEGALRLVENLRLGGVDVVGRRVLEIGSGWHPIVPVILLVAGARSVALTDLDRLLDARLLRSALDFVQQRREAVTGRLGGGDFERLAVPEGDLDSMLKALGMTYTVPWHTRMTPDQSVDIIISRSVLEHIAPSILDSMLADCRRILAPGGAMAHLIDVSDHRAMRDKTLSRCAFLEYEELPWRMMSLNPQSYHNRLRYSDHIALIGKNGFNITYALRQSRTKEQDEVRAMRLASRFRGRDVEDLAAIGVHVVARVP